MNNKNKDLYIKFLIICIFLLSIQLLIFSPETDILKQGFPIHILFLICLILLGIPLKDKNNCFIISFDFFILLLFLYKICNLIIAPIKFIPLHQLIFSFEGIITYFLGRFIFSKKPYLFYGSLLGFSLLIGWSSLIFSFRYNQIYFTNLYFVFLPISIIFWITFLFSIFPYKIKSNLFKLLIPILFLFILLFFWVFHIKPIVYKERTYTHDKQRIISAQVERTIFASHPLFGVGAGNLKKIYVKYKPEPNFIYSPNYSSYFNMLAELGFIGVGLFLLGIIYFILKIYKIHNGITDQKLKLLFWGSILVLFFMLVENAFVPIFSLTYGRFLLLSVLGFALTIGYENNSKENINFFYIKNNYMQKGIYFFIFFISIIINVIILLNLIYIKNPSINKKYLYLSPQQQINLLKFTMPFHPEPYRREAAFLKSELVTSKDNIDFKKLLIENAYKKALAKNQYEPTQYLELANYYSTILKDNKQAIYTLEKGTNFCPAEWEIYFLLGKYFEYSVNYQNSITSYSKVVYLNPEFLEGHFLIAKINKMLGIHLAMQKEYTYLLQKNPISLKLLYLWLNLTR